MGRCGAVFLHPYPQQQPPIRSRPMNESGSRWEWPPRIAPHPRPIEPCIATSSPCQRPGGHLPAGDHASSGLETLPTSLASPRLGLRTGATRTVAGEHRPSRLGWPDARTAAVGLVRRPFHAIIAAIRSPPDRLQQPARHHPAGRDWSQPDTVFHRASRLSVLGDFVARW